MLVTKRPVVLDMPTLLRSLVWSSSLRFFFEANSPVLLPAVLDAATWISRQVFIAAAYCLKPWWEPLQVRCTCTHDLVPRLACYIYICIAKLYIAKLCIYIFKISQDISRVNTYTRPLKTAQFISMDDVRRFESLHDHCLPIDRFWSQGCIALLCVTPSAGLVLMKLWPHLRWVITTASKCITLELLCINRHV